MTVGRAVILASKSPRRRELFEKYGINAKIHAASVDETIPPEITDAHSTVRYLARKKAMQVSSLYEEKEIIVAADTLVFLDGEIFGKPKNKEDARRMMRLFSGNQHSVITGICVFDGETEVTESVETLVTFRRLSEEEIEAYISTDEPYDKAGGYGIQSLGGAFVERIFGDYYNVVGLPIAELLTILRDNFGLCAFEELCKKMGAGNE